MCSLGKITRSKQKILTHYLLNVGPASQTVVQHHINLGSPLAVGWGRMPHQYRSLLQCPFQHRGCPKLCPRSHQIWLEHQQNGGICRRFVHFQRFQDITSHVFIQCFFYDICNFLRGWHTVYDAGLTLNQHWLNILWLLWPQFISLALPARGTSLDVRIWRL